MPGLPRLPSEASRHVFHSSVCLRVMAKEQQSRQECKPLESSAIFGLAPVPGYTAQNYQTARLPESTPPPACSASIHVRSAYGAR